MQKEGKWGSQTPTYSLKGWDSIRSPSVPSRISTSCWYETDERMLRASSSSEASEKQNNAKQPPQPTIGPFKANVPKGTLFSSYRPSPYKVHISVTNVPRPSALPGFRPPMPKATVPSTTAYRFTSMIPQIRRLEPEGDNIAQRQLPINSPLGRLPLIRENLQENKKKHHCH